MRKSFIFACAHRSAYESECAYLLTATLLSSSLIFTLPVEMERNKMADAGNTDGTFYQTNMQPANWYTWFSKEGAKDE